MTFCFFIVLLPLAAGQSTMDRRRVAVKVSNDRRRSELRETIAKFQGEPWESPAWEKQDGIAGKLERAQQDSFDEILQQNREVKQDLELSVQDQSDYFATAERDFSEAILLIRTEREQITGNLKVADGFFNAEVVKMKGWIESMRSTDKDYYAALQKTWKNTHSKYLRDANNYFKELTGVKMGETEGYKNKVKDMAENYVKLAEKKAQSLKAKYEKATQKATADCNKLKQKHQKNVASGSPLTTKIKNLEKTTGELEKNKELNMEITDFGAGAADKTDGIKGQLEKLKKDEETNWDSDESATQGYYAAAKVKRDDMTEALTGESKAQGEYNTVGLKETYGKDAANSKGKQYEDKVKADVAKIKSRTTVVQLATERMQREVENFLEGDDGLTRDGKKMGVKMLERKIDELTGASGDSDMSIEKATEKLQQFSNGMQDFSADAKGKIRESEAKIIDELGEAKDAFSKQIDANVEMIAQKKDAKETETFKEIDGDVAGVKKRLMDYYDNMISTKSGPPKDGTIQATVQDDQNEMKDLAAQMGAEVEGIQLQKEKQTQLTVNTQTLGKTLDLQMATVDAREEVNLKKGEQRNEAKADEMIEGLTALKERMHAATERGVKDIDKAGSGAMRKITGAADEQVGKLNQLMSQAKAAALQAVKAKSDVENLSGNINDYQSQTDKLEDAVQKVTTEFADYSSSAKTMAENLEPQADEVLGQAMTEAKTHVATLEDSGKAELTRMDTAVDKLVEQSKKRASSMQDDVQHEANLATSEENTVHSELIQDVARVEALAEKVADPSDGEVRAAKVTVEKAHEAAQVAAQHAYDAASANLESYKNMFNGNADPGSKPEGGSLKVFMDKAEALIGENGLRGHATTLSEQADADVLAAAKAAASKVKKSQTSMNDKVSDMHEDLLVKAGDVDAREHQLDALGNEAKKVRQDADRSASKLQDFSADVEETGSTIKQAQAVGEKELDNMVTTVTAKSEKEAAKVKAGGEAVLADASSTISGEQKQLKRDMNKMSDEEQAAIDALKSNSDDEAKGAEKTMRELSSETMTTQDMADRRNKAMDDAFSEIMEEANEQKNKFESQLKLSKADLLKLQENGEMEDLIDKIVDLEDATTDGVEKITKADHTRVGKLKATAEETETDIVAKTEKTKDKVRTFEDSLSGLQKEATEALEKASQMEAGFEEDMAAKQRSFQNTLMGAKQERMEATNAYTHDVDTSTHSIDTTLDMMKTLASKVTGQIKYELGTLQLDQAKLDRQLDHTLSLEKYGEEGAIERLSTKLANATRNEDELDELREQLQNKSTAFRARVTEDFKRLGYDFDMSAVDEAAARAHEEYYIQQQQARLKAELGETLGDLGDLSNARLAALAKSSGAKIAALMRNSDLSEEERAAKLQEIRAHARAHAQTILEANGHLQLEQETAARQLQVVTDEVESSMSRISALGNVGSATGAQGLAAAIARIQELIEQANQKIGDAPLPEEEKVALAEKQSAETADETEMRTATETTNSLAQEGAKLIGDTGEPQAPGPVHGVLNSLMAAFNPAMFHAKSLLETHGASAGKLVLAPTDAVPIVMEAERTSARALVEDDRLGDRLAKIEQRLREQH